MRPVLNKQHEQWLRKQKKLNEKLNKKLNKKSHTHTHTQTTIMAAAAAEIEAKQKTIAGHLLMARPIHRPMKCSDLPLPPKKNQIIKSNFNRRENITVTTLRYLEIT